VSSIWLEEASKPTCNYVFLATLVLVVPRVFVLTVGSSAPAMKVNDQRPELGRLLIVVLWDPDTIFPGLVRIACVINVVCGEVVAVTSRAVLVSMAKTRVGTVRQT
jgi:hypothetical protein